MSFGGFGSGQQSGSTFGGFGSGGTSGGFGSQTTSSGSLFGGQTATSGGFGGFGGNQQQNNPFATNKPAFGAPATTSSGGGVFGGSTTGTSGGFGSGGTGFGQSNTGTGFGSSTGGGLFGQNKPATTGFGASNTGGSLFGGGQTNTGGGFGGGATGSNPFSTGASTGGTGFGASTGGGGGFGGFGGSSSAGNNNNGTANPPFSVTQEKEPTGQGMQAFQSITFQDPYKNKCFEELRTEDYAQGRKYGNTNGQAGAFGQSTGFGGFGQQQTSSGGGGLFGQQNNTSTSGSTGFGGFGGNQQQSTGGAFGSSIGGGLFGQNKPAGGGLFGNSTTSSAPASNPFGGTTAGSGGGLFGGSSGGGFGSNTGTSTGGGLFGGGQQQQQQSNPFGQSSTNTGGGLFGQQQNKPAGGGLFGGSNTGSTGGGLFGGGQQQQQSNPFGQSGNTGGSLFGNNQQQNQQKPAFGGFGQSTNTGGGGLFGNTQQQSNTGGGLFGNQQNKPAGGGLFGGSTANTGGGLFGNNQSQQQNTGGSLFGNSTNQGGSLFGNQQNKPAGGSLFGNSTTGQSGGLFGNTQQNQNTGGSSLFGNTTSQNQQPSNSLFGSTNSQQATQQQPNSLHASITGAPYGNEQLFASLAAPSPPVGPLATPLNGAKPAPRKTPSLMASMRLNSPVYTPRGGSLGRNSGYGFSYSTYGTPGSAYGTPSLTPGASSMLRPTGSFNSALASRLNKSISVGNLRGDGTPGEGRSLLRESALSPPGTGGRYGGGSVRKLNIDHSLRTDLFGRDEQRQPPSRRVHYDESAESPNETPRQEPSRENALVRTETEETEQEESPVGLLKAGPQAKPPKQPEMSQINGSNGALSTVPEDNVPRERPGSAPATQQRPASRYTAPAKDTEAGEYWTEPPLRQLQKMSRQQLQKVGKFTVGRHGYGRVEFGPCDLSSVDLDRVCGDIVVLEARKATVYPDTMKKPPMGQGLNVPSTIYLEQSWARSHGGKKHVTDRNTKEYQKHVQRLKRVVGTNYKDYDPENGVWVFTVEHFTTYGLDDDDDEDFTEQTLESSGLSDAPAEQQDASMQSVEAAEGEVPDDTFEFKLERRSTRSVPGGFGEQSVSYDYDDPSADEAMEEDAPGETMLEDSFRSSGGAVQAPSPGAVERYHSSILEQDEEQPTGDISREEQVPESPDMPGAFAPEPKQLRSILKPSAGFNNAFASPEKLATESWEEQLQRTISPRKRDRQALKDMQASMKAKERDDDVLDSPFKHSLLGRSTLGQSALGQSYLAQKSAKKSNGGEELGKSQGFMSRMDLMNSLWGEEKQSAKKARTSGKGFEYPYPKKPRLSAADDLDDNDAAFHDSPKPSFAADGTLVYAAAGSTPQISGGMAQSKRSIVGEHRDVRFAKFTVPEGLMNGTIEMQMEITQILEKKGVEVPFAEIAGANVVFRDLAAKAQGSMSKSPTQLEKQEVAIWRLCSVLFDSLNVACSDFIKEVPEALREQYAGRLRRDAFVAFWSKTVAESVEAGLKTAKSVEEKALLLLTKNDIAGACEVLVGAKDFRLASLIAQLPGSEVNREVISKQIAAWQKRKDWSEMSDAVRALYSILAGEVCQVAGQAGASEDRMSGFGMAQKFGLSWEQSLGLRVCYGGFEMLKDAINACCADVDAGKEAVKPLSPWTGRETEDTLMTLCRLFASANEVDAEALCEPTTVSNTALNSRIAWQLADTLSAKNIHSLPDAKQAQITLSFATELEAAGKLVESAWVLLHLRDAPVRRKAIAGLLQRNADKIPDPSSLAGQKTDFERLVGDFNISRSMVFAAKALYAKATGDLYSQARCLLLASHVEEAHEVLCTFVGPQAVIEQEHEALSALLSEFPDVYSRNRDLVPAWKKGGEVFANFLRLIGLGYAARQGREFEDLVRALRKGLRGMESDVEDGGKRLEQRVAGIEMRRVVEETARAAGEEGPRNRGAKATESEGYGEGIGMLNAYRERMGAIV